MKFHSYVIAALATSQEVFAAPTYVAFADVVVYHSVNKFQLALATLESNLEKRLTCGINRPGF